MSIKQAFLSDLSIVKKITEVTIAEIYPRYYPKGAVDFSWHIIARKTSGKISRKTSCFFILIYRRSLLVQLRYGTMKSAGFSFCHRIKERDMVLNCLILQREGSLKNIQKLFWMHRYQGRGCTSREATETRSFILFLLGTTTFYAMTLWKNGYKTGIWREKPHGKTKTHL